MGGIHQNIHSMHSLRPAVTILENYYEKPNSNTKEGTYKMFNTCYFEKLNISTSLNYHWAKFYLNIVDTWNVTKASKEDVINMCSNFYYIKIDDTAE